MNNNEAPVQNLIAKAAAAEKSEDAMRFSQAALNAANALTGMSNIKRDEK